MSKDNILIIKHIIKNITNRLLIETDESKIKRLNANLVTAKIKLEEYEQI